MVWKQYGYNGRRLLESHESGDKQRVLCDRDSLLKKGTQQIVTTNQERKCMVARERIIKRHLTLFDANRPNA